MGNDNKFYLLLDTIPKTEDNQCHFDRNKKLQQTLDFVFTPLDIKLKFTSKYNNKILFCNK